MAAIPLLTKYTKTDSRLTSTTKYTSRYASNYNGKDFKYITNTKVLAKNEKLRPTSSTDAGITPAAKKRLRYNLNMNGRIWGPGEFDTNIMTNFDRLYSIYPEYELSSLCQYVFIVRPDTNILDSVGNLVSAEASSTGPNSSPASDAYMRWMYNDHKNLLKCISGGVSGSHDFISFLVGRTESLNLADYSLKDYKMNQPFTDYNLPYASHALASQTGGQFEIAFREDEDLRIHKMFQAWTYYISAVTRNLFEPKLEHIRDNRLDYTCSVYCITCKADATTIVHWAKYTGAFPTSVPNSDLSFNLRGAPNRTVTIPFDYFYQESFNPFILVDFNKNAHITVSKTDTVGYIPVYRSQKISDMGLSAPKTGKAKYSKSAPISLGSGNALVGCPFICRTGKGANSRYELRWKKNSLTI